MNTGAVGGPKFSGISNGAGGENKDAKIKQDVRTMIQFMSPDSVAQKLGLSVSAVKRIAGIGDGL